MVRRSPNQTTFCLLLSLVHPRSLSQASQEDPILTPTEPQPRHLFHLHDSTCMIYSRGHLITQLPRFEKCPQRPVIGQTDSRAARLEGSMSDRNLRYHRSSSIFPWAFWIRTWFTAGWMPRHPRDSNAGPIANSKISWSGKNSPDSMYGSECDTPCDQHAMFPERSEALAFLNGHKYYTLPGAVLTVLFLLFTLTICLFCNQPFP